MKVVLNTFGGITPRSPEHRQRSTSARVAHNVKLRNGVVESWRELCEFAPAPNAKSFHVYGCCPVSWDRVVQAAEVAVDWGRFYISDREGTGIEQVVVSPDCESVTTYKLGVPNPTTPPTVIGDDSCERTSDARSYVYTYVNAWGEESSPSPASNVIRVKDGSTVIVSGIQLPPDGYNITSVYVYRSATGFQQADGKIQKALTDFLFVGVVVLPSTSFTDDVPLAGLGEVLETRKTRMPPAGMQNVCSIEGVVRLAGTKDNRVHLSENFQLHNWPVKYDLTLDSQIVHMGCLDQKLYVTTNTIPYVIDVSSCEELKCTPVLDVQAPLPDISCAYNHASLITPHGMVYSSNVGVILINPQAQWQILTANWLSHEDWLRVRPETARFGYWQGHLFIITDAVSFVLDINGRNFADEQGGELSTISDSPIDMMTTGTGTLLMLIDGEIYAWDKGSTLRDYFWESVLISLTPMTQERYYSISLNPGSKASSGPEWNPSMVKVRTKETTFSLIGDHATANGMGRTVFTRRITGEKSVRMPRIGRHPYYHVRLEGTEMVEFVELGTSILR